MKKLIAIFGILIICVAFIFFTDNQTVTATVYVTSFLITILLRKYYKRLDLSGRLVEAYAVITIIITLGLFYCMLMASPEPKDHKSIILIVAIPVGLLNVSTAIDLSNVIAKNKKT